MLRPLLILGCVLLLDCSGEESSSISTESAERAVHSPKEVLIEFDRLISGPADTVRDTAALLALFRPEARIEIILGEGMDTGVFTLTPQEYIGIFSVGWYREGFWRESGRMTESVQDNMASVRSRFEFRQGASGTGTQMAQFIWEDGYWQIAHLVWQEAE